MEANYKKEMGKNVMVIEAQNRCWSDYETQMFSYNCIRGLLRFYVLIEDGEVSFVYDVSDMETVSSHIKRKGMTRQEFGLFVIGMKRAIRGIEDYMLNESALILSPDYVFVDYECRKFRFCYVPGLKPSESGNFRDMIGTMISLIIKKEGMVSPWISSLASQLESEGFTLKDMELDGLRINIPKKCEDEPKAEENFSGEDAMSRRLKISRRMDTGESREKRRAGDRRRRREERREAGGFARRGFSRREYADIFD